MPHCPGGSGQGTSRSILPHCLGAVGSGTPAIHCLTACGQWAVDLLENTAPLPGCNGQWTSCNTPPHSLGCGVVWCGVVWYCIFFFLRHGGPPPKALHQSGLTMGKMSVHGEPKFSEGQPRVFTNQVRVKTLHELHHGPEKVKILAEAISVKDAKGYIAYTKAK